MTTPVRIKTTFSRDAYYLGGLKAAGKHLFFTQDGNMQARELWKTDGSSSGTTLVANIRGPFDSSPRLTAVGNTVFFIAEDTSGSDYALWRSNGNASGTIPLKEGLFPSNLTAVGDRLFFSANVGDTDSELWISDGSKPGTFRVADINPGTSSSYPRNLTAVGDTLFFSANDGRSGYELWRSDGSDAGTRRVADINPEAGSSSPTDLTAVFKRLFFFVSGSKSGQTLWTSDGTASGTVQVTDQRLGRFQRQSRYATAVGNTLFFVAQDKSAGRELWKSDGTAKGTVRVSDIRPGSIGSDPQGLTAVGNRLFFTADDGKTGRELWTSDGSHKGTVQVADINPGRASSDIYRFGLASIGNRVYFGANDGKRGEELWQSDGTNAGTTRVADLYSGRNGSLPSGLTAVGSRLYFRAYTKRDGYSNPKLWKLDTLNPQITSVGRRGSVGGSARSRRVQGAGVEPRAAVDLLNGRRLLAITTSDGRGNFSYAFTPEAIEKLGQGSGKRIRARQFDEVGNAFTSTNTLFSVNTLEGSQRRDRLTGEANTRDTFSWRAWSDSLLERYDTITNFERRDRLRVEDSLYSTTLNTASGQIRGLNPKQIRAVLGGTNFAAGEAAAFTVRDREGTFVVLNDTKPGFQAGRDALVFLNGYTISANNPVVII